jgi:hypothetical protein
LKNITLRFYGRIVIAEQRTTKKLSFLMPNMEFGESKLRKHRPLMSVARHRVSLGPGDSTFEPTDRIMTEGKPLESEYLIWDLTGWNVGIAGARGGVNLAREEDTDLIDLAELEDKQGRTAKLTSTSLRATATGAVIAAIDVEHGVGVATALEAGALSFVPLDAALGGKFPIVLDPRVLIDIVDVAVTADTHLRLVFTRDGLPDRQLTIHRTEDDEAGDITVSFTNLCTCMPPDEDPVFDEEFGQYYRLLDDVAADRLVPHRALSGGSQSCNRMARITYT